jgi:hypothetical protein
MSTKHEAAKPPVLVLRRPSAAQRARVEEPVAAPAPEPVAAQTNVEAPKIVAAQTIAAPPAPAPKPTRSREAERIEAEPDADFFVSIPKSKKNALKAHCAQRGISMRDWLLGVLNEKGIGK